MLYSTGDTLWQRESDRTAGDGLFEDPGAQPRHQVVGGGLSTGKSLSAPSVTWYQGSQWVAWLEGPTIRVRPIWWGPARTREVYTGSNAARMTSPAIASFGGRLVAVWGEAGTLYFSTSKWGIRWTPPERHYSSTFGQYSPSVALHQGFLYVGVSDPKERRLYTIRITPDWTWGPTYLAHEASDPLLPQVSVASDGSKLSMAFATEHAVRVIHSATGYSSWSAPVMDVASDQGAPYLVAPVIHWWNGRLYVFYYPASAPLDLVMKRSKSRLGLYFGSEEVKLESPLLPRRPAVVSSDYSVVPAEPQITVLHQASSPAHHLNVIYVAEAYQADELDQFSASVARGLPAFTLLAPFRQNLDLLNIYRIDLPSRQGGVKRSPDLVEAYASYPRYPGGIGEALYSDTAFGSQFLGEFTDGSLDRRAEDPVVDPSQYVANGMLQLTIDSYDDLDQKIAQWIPDYDRQRDLVYVVTNGEINVQQINGDPLVNLHGMFEHVAFVHETGHNLGGLKDEDLDFQCDLVGQDSPDCAAPNKTLNSDLRDPSHKWAHFFVDFDGDGEVDPGDSILADVSSSWAGPSVDGLQNYWDPGVMTFASVLNPGIWATYGDTGWGSTGGQHIFGPSEECLMNHAGGITRFCPVCAEALVSALWTRAGLGFGPEMHQMYHEVYSRVYLEYEHQHPGDPAWPKAGYLEVNDIPVPESDYAGACHGLRSMALPSQTCSLDITGYIPEGPVFSTIRFVGPDDPRSHLFYVQTVQVVNGSGAALPLRPVSDLGSYYDTYYTLTHRNWSFAGAGDLVLEVHTNRSVAP